MGHSLRLSLLDRERDGVLPVVRTTWYIPIVRNQWDIAYCPICPLVDEHLGQRTKVKDSIEHTLLSNIALEGWQFSAEAFSEGLHGTTFRSCEMG